jgi:hypothetical protein
MILTEHSPLAEVANLSKAKHSVYDGAAYWSSENDDRTGM